MTSSDDRLLIVGAGPTGLAMAKAFREANIPYIQVEATGSVGGNWAHGVYDTAHIISSRRTTEYADHPMPAEYPDFPSAAQMRTYFDEYADTYGLRADIRFETTLVSAVPRADGRWSVEYGDGRAEVVKGLVVCNGHHWDRRYPAWVAQFGGEVLHSKDYKRPDQLRDKRVLVLGGGNSGCDVVSEAARVSASADWSLRRGYWFLPKTFFGIPTVEFMKPWLPVVVQRAVLRSLVPVVLGSYQSHGLPTPDHKLFEAHPTLNSEVFHYLKHGRIRVRPDVARAEGRSVHYGDGSHGDYDLVVCATGFDVSFPFLPAGMVPVVGKTAQLYAGMLRPDARHLYVMGTVQARYGIGPLLRPLAVLTAELVKFQDQLTIPLGELLRRTGDKLPNTHLVDPHAALRRMRMGHLLLPLLRWRARRLGVWRGG